MAKEERSNKIRDLFTLEELRLLKDALGSRELSERVTSKRYMLRDLFLDFKEAYGSKLGQSPS